MFQSKMAHIWFLQKYKKFILILCSLILNLDLKVHNPALVAEWSKTLISQIPVEKTVA